ncbi:hypothetical protein NKR23_g3884 [Pleurostoma richardsiae]|uniref:DUF7721 domain-containing protein n=1 Tax=Pleurostoma richardsiae TaxID=41990 RepID=A0AA38VWD6_9PEZI|nr:hypothetical protein NKR23_g3884 [Pleurostoma richardsiae]
MDKIINAFTQDDDNDNRQQGQHYGGNISHGGSYPAGGGYPTEDDDDLRGAAETASRHAGDSGDSNLFESILGALGQKKQRLANEDVDEDDAVRQHKKFFGGDDDDDGKEATSGGIGAAAAMQALKMFGTGGATAGSSSQNVFIGMAMSEASKLFDQQASKGKVSSDADKESAVMQAGETALKMYLKSQGSSGPGGVLGLASKFM